MVIGLAGLAVSSVLGIRRERISDGRRLTEGAVNRSYAMHIGVANDPTRPLIDEIRWIAANGFGFVDLHMSPPNLRWSPAGKTLRIWRELGSPQSARRPTCPSIIPPRSSARPRSTELRRCINRHLQTPLLTTLFCGWPSHLPEESGYDYLRQYLSILIEHGEPQGVAVALENAADNRRQLKHFREIFRRLPNLKLAYDIGSGNVSTAKSMTRDYLFAFADRLRHVRISDNDGTRPAYLPFARLNPAT